MSGHRRFVLVLEDRQIITCVVNYLRPSADSFARAQAHSILRSCLCPMVEVPAAYDQLEAEVHTGPCWVWFSRFAKNVQLNVANCIFVLS